MQVLDDNGWDGLQNSEWRVLENVQELLQPFAEHNSEEYTTISSVVPIVVGSIKVSLVRHVHKA